MGLAMYKKIIFFSSITLLSGCGDSPIDIVKNQHFNNFSDYTIGELLDNRGVCENVEWSENKESKTVLYTCTLKKGKDFYTFNENYANTLRENQKQKGLELASKKTADVINNSKEILATINEQNTIINNLLNDKRNVFTLYKNEDYKNYIYKAVREYNRTQDSYNFKSKAIMEFGLMPHSDVTFEDVQDVYQYLIENNKTDSVNHRFLKRKIEGDEQESGLYQQCVSVETYNAIQTMKNDKSWINEVNSKHYLEMKKLCIENLKGFKSDTYNQDLDNCIAYSYKPDYGKLAREQGLNEETKNNIVRYCSERKDKKLVEYRNLLDKYNISIRNELVSLLNKQLIENEKILEDSERTLKFYGSNNRKIEENKESDKYAEASVVRYSLTNILKGEEKILWEYSDTSKKYIVRNMENIQYEYGGTTMTSSLFLDVLIYSSINNVNDIDSYMRSQKKKIADSMMKYY